MQLKQLRILGFKTFAEKTEIEIDGGLTAIVGPNGSGKSNIVDALLWVLGEQNPRLLRGTSSQDMIFSGSDRRKPLGMAEVRLTIDNSDKTLPIEFNEVVVTRRVYRSGESQYLLNNAPCRLKDIVELFLDTGMGKGAYSFVSQSEIDAVLSARAEDRRELFEEAAGIKKYRVRKKDALRRLDNAEDNLTRVRDIMQEIESGLEPLERQAEEARRYLLLQERLHEIEVGMLVAEFQKADYELDASRQERTNDTVQLETLNTEAMSLESSAALLNDELARMDGELDAALKEQQAARAGVDRVESRLAVLAERSSSTGRTRDQLDIDLRHISQQIEKLADSIEFDQSERDKVDRDENALKADWAGHRAALTELDKALDDAARKEQERQTMRVRLVAERGAREGALNTAQDRIKDFSARISAVNSTIVELQQSLSEANDRNGEISAERDSVLAEQGRLNALEEAVSARLERQQDELRSLRTSLDAARRLGAEQAAKLQTLKDLQDNHDGFYQGVRAVLNASRSRQINGNYTAVVDLLTVPERYRIAIEVALGGSLQDIVTHTEAEAKAGIEWLKRNRAGRATFLPLPLLRPSARAHAPSIPGITVHNAADIVECDREYQAVLELLLSRVLVVDTMDDAIRVSRQGGGWSRIVTIEGEVLSPGGALSGGSLQGRGAHLVGRKGEIDDLSAELPVTRAEVGRLDAATEAHIASLQQGEQERAAILRERSTARAELARLDAALAASGRDRTRIDRELSDGTQQHGQLTVNLRTQEQEVVRLTALLEADRRESAQADTAIVALGEEASQLTVRRDERRGVAVRLEVEISRLKAEREALTRSIAADRASLALLEEQQTQKIRLRDASETESNESEAERHSLTDRLDGDRERLQVASDVYEACRQRRQSCLLESQAAGSKMRTINQTRETLRQSIHDAEVRIARSESDSNNSLTRLQEQYGISREDALSRPDDTPLDKNTSMEVGRLRRELKAMSSVNLGAIEEYATRTERYAEMSAQRTDLETARESLLNTISEIDESTRGVFMETFQAVSVEFQRLFERLFGGGTTRLLLTTPEDLLETGIDVIAQPPGKKPQNLSLLSGGERALTATALLFAFLAVRPSPFVILDEVDAPLDGANVDKFTALIKDFSQRSQFILITHNPVTMEAAPTWYGVTMREAGISSIVSYRVPQESTETQHDSTIVLTSPEG